MIRLDTATKVIRLYLDNPVATNELDWNASWDDLKPSITRAFTPMAVNGASNGTTPVVMVTAPSALHYNNVKYISVHNNDTVQRGITIELFDGVNSRILITASLQTADTLIYNDGAGWVLMSENGSIRIVTTGTQ